MTFELKNSREGVVEKRFNNGCTGAGMFGNLFVGFLLCMITLGIYCPWFMVKMMKYIYGNSQMKGSARGEVTFDFKGGGAELFGIMFVGVLLTMVTFGIYYPWFMVSMSRWKTSNMIGRDASGREYTGTFNGTGGQLFGIMFVGILLSVITLGIYMPWFMCKVWTYFAKNIEIVENGRKVGTFEFKGEGAPLLGICIVGILLSAVTLGIYSFWFRINLLKYLTEATTVTFEGQTSRMTFVGTGGKFFVLVLVGVLLSIVTLGIYSFWFMTNLLKFFVENMVILDNGYRPNYAEPVEVIPERAAY